MASVLVRGPSLAEQAAASIRDRIVRGVLSCGEPLSEIALARELGVSKTPVREALMELKRQGLVEVHPQRGTFVFDMAAEEVEQLGELRLVLEVAALRLALTRAPDALLDRWRACVAGMDRAIEAGDIEAYRLLDGEFHAAMFEVVGNVFFAEAFLVAAFRAQALRNRLSRDPMLNSKSYDEHVRLLDLAERGDIAGAAALMAEHIVFTRDTYLATLDARSVGAPAASPPPAPFDPSAVADPPIRRRPARTRR